MQTKKNNIFLYRNLHVHEVRENENTVPVDGWEKKTKKTQRSICLYHKQTKYFKIQPFALEMKNIGIRDAKPPAMQNSLYHEYMSIERSKSKEISFP